MKTVFAVLLTTSCPFLATSAFAQTFTLDVRDPLIASGLVDELKGFLPGNSSDANLSAGTISLVDSGIDFGASLRLHLNQVACVNIPFAGRRCADVYNTWTTVSARIALDPTCKVTAVDVTREETSGDILATEALALVWPTLQGILERRLSESVSGFISENETLRAFCAL